jgi:uncharacterized membrane protein YdjX (TVP38/TMEM64 family)
MERRKRWISYLWRGAALLIVIAVSIFVFSMRDLVEKSARFGYAGIFLFTLLTYATVILPVPGVTVVFAMGTVLNPLWVGVAAGTGAALGELTSYAAGYSGQAVVEKVALYQRIHGWLKQRKWKTFVSLVVFSAMPNPFFNLAGIAAGALRVPVLSYLFASLIGETIKMWLFAFAGAYSIYWIARFSR